MPLISNERARPDVLRTVAKDRKWGFRYNVKVTLARNPQTPVETALGILPALKKRDLDAVASDVRIPAAVRRRANLLLGRGAG